MLLEIKNLRVNYGKAEALKGISMGVESGAIVALLGANGAGKSTTLRTISGLKKLTSGEIWYQGERIDGLPAHEIVRRGIAHIPEGRLVFATLTVKENLEMGAYLIKDKQEREERLVRIFDYFPILKERQAQPAISLSGGEQQMLAVGRGLMGNPRIMLLDEPSQGLSPIMVNAVRDIIKNLLGQHGLTLLLVEQNFRLTLKLATRHYLMGSKGKIERMATTEELMANEEIIKKHLAV